MRTSTKPTQQDGLAMQRLTSCLAASTSAAEISAILTELLSPSEYLGISRRWQLLELLYQGLSQREIAAQLHLSLGTVNRGSRELKHPQSALKKLIEQAQAKRTPPDDITLTKGND